MVKFFEGQNVLGDMLPKRNTTTLLDSLEEFSNTLTYALCIVVLRLGYNPKAKGRNDASGWFPRWRGTANFGKFNFAP